MIPMSKITNFVSFSAPPPAARIVRFVVKPQTQYELESGTRIQSHGAKFGSVGFGELLFGVGLFGAVGSHQQWHLYTAK